MFAKPDVGKELTVVTNWSDYHKGSVNHVRIHASKTKYTGTVVESAHFDDPNSFRLFTGNPNYPVSVIQLERVTKLTYNDGSAAETRDAPDLSDNEAWEVPGSKGSYIVTRRGATWHCECKGWQFRNSCKHVIEKKQEVLDRT